MTVTVTVAVWSSGILDSQSEAAMLSGVRSAQLGVRG